VIDNHLDTDVAVIIDGDYLLPSLDAAFDDDRVRSLWINEPSVEQIEANYRLREPAAGSQRVRAEVSARYGHWLMSQAAALGLTIIDARPWQDAVERAIRTVS